MTEPDLWEKTSFWDNAQKHPQNRVLNFAKKKKVDGCVDFLGLNHDGLYDSVKTTCVGKIWFLS